MIKYDSSWHNSFLSGSDELPLDRDNKRDFIATSKSKEVISKPITESTVLGVLCRLIGDQRKLHKIKVSESYYFKDIENLISFDVDKHEESISTETVFLINKTNSRPAQSTFLGVIPDNTELFFSQTAQQIWSVLYLNLDDLLDFISAGTLREERISVSPRDLLFRIKDIDNIKCPVGLPVLTLEQEKSDLLFKIDKEKVRFLEIQKKYLTFTDPNSSKKNSFEKARIKHQGILEEYESDLHKLQACDKRALLEENLQNSIQFLSGIYPDMSYLDKGKVYRMSLYAAALYLQVSRMIDSGMILDYCINKSGDIGIQGFSKRGFNGVRDFINPLTGSKKKTVGTPFSLTKTSGILNINIDADKDRCKQIESLINSAGVSGFYLGKKGLAYVSDIRL